MASNPFKTFHVYPMQSPKGDVYRLLSAKKVAQTIEEKAEDLAAADPSGGQWRMIGLVHVQHSYAHDLDGAGVMFCVQFNEKILPAKVRDEHVAKAAAKFYDEVGRQPSKKDYAILRDEVEFALLPKAFVKRSNVYVIITPESHAFVYNGSAKKCQDALLVIQRLMDNYFENSFVGLSFQEPIMPFLDALACEGEDEEGVLIPGSAGLLKGPNKRSIAIKDRDIESPEVQKLLTSKVEEDRYHVHSLHILKIDPESMDTELSFTLNDKLRFSGAEFPDTVLSAGTDKGEDGKIAFHSMAWLSVKEHRNLLQHITPQLGGLQQSPVDSETAAEEDEEV